MIFAKGDSLDCFSRISLYSLIDTIIVFIDNLYGDVGLGINLRDNSCANEDLINRLIAVRTSKQYTDGPNIYEMMNSIKQKQLLKQEIARLDDDLPF